MQTYLCSLLSILAVLEVKREVKSSELISNLRFLKLCCLCFSRESNFCFLVSYICISVAGHMFHNLLRAIIRTFLHT